MICISYAHLFERKKEKQNLYRKRNKARRTQIELYKEEKTKLCFIFLCSDKQQLTNISFENHAEKQNKTIENRFVTRQITLKFDHEKENIDRCKCLSNIFKFDRKSVDSCLAVATKPNESFDLHVRRTLFDGNLTLLLTLSMVENNLCLFDDCSASLMLAGRRRCRTESEENNIQLIFYTKYQLRFRHETLNRFCDDVCV